LLDITFGGQPVTDFNKQGARRDILGQLDRAVESLRIQRGDYQGLTEAQQALRPQVLDFVVKWREKCREHPSCVVSIVP
jgi:hypothetical protein